MFWCCYNAVDMVDTATDEAGTSEVMHGDAPLGSAQRGLTEGPLPEDGRQDEVPTSLPEVLEPSAEGAPKAEDPKAEDSKAQDSDDEDAGDGPFSVTLRMNPGERLGALLDVLDMKTLRVVQVRQTGRIRTHNLQAAENRKVLPGYFIVSVNGKNGGAEALVAEMRRSRTWHMKVARKQEFTIKLEKTGPLCLDLQFEKDSDCMVIRKIGDGVVKEHNQTLAADSEQRVRVYDRILSVNGQGGPAKAMVQTIRSQTQLTLHISRPLLNVGHKEPFAQSTSASSAAAAVGGA